MFMSETETGIPTIKDLIGRAVKEALPKDQVQKLVDENEFSPLGTILVKTPQELETIIKATRDMFPSVFSHLTDKAITDWVKHEEEHITHARAEYERRSICADYYYGIRYGKDGDSIGLMPIYYITTDTDIPEEVLKGNAEAPTYLSEADRAKARKFSK